MLAIFKCKLLFFFFKAICLSPITILQCDPGFQMLGVTVME